MSKGPHHVPHPLPRKISRAGSAGYLFCSRPATCVTVSVMMPPPGNWLIRVAAVVPVVLLVTVAGVLGLLGLLRGVFLGSFRSSLFRFPDRFCYGLDWRGFGGFLHATDHRLCRRMSKHGDRAHYQISHRVGDGLGWFFFLGSKLFLGVHEILQAGSLTDSRNT